MLNRLRIENIALIDELEVKFGRGLNVLTGSTGAGKSVIVNAIELAAGIRASEETIRTGKNKALVESEFGIEGLDPASRNELSEYITDNRTITLRREIKRSGGGKAYIGEKPVNLSTLKQVAGYIVSILGQHSHQSLLNPSTHINYLDDFTGLDDDLAELKRLYNNVVDLREKLSFAERNRIEIKDRMELLKFQLSEIERAGLRSDEEESLKNEKKILENSRAITESGELAIAILLESDGSVIDRVGETGKILRDSSEGQSQFSDILGLISSAADSINEAAVKIRNFIDAVEDNPERLEEINSRLQEIFRLKKKYGTDITGILEYAKKSEAELAGLQLKTGDPETFRTKLEEERAKLNRLAEKISDARKTAKEKLENSVQENLSKMAMQKARFDIEITSEEDENGIFNIKGIDLAGNSSGIDLVEFLFCANPGEGLKPLAKIASGGEISRVMLALKNAFLSKSGGGCEIFDEIDVGISGEAASMVADQLKLLAGSHQVICITHLHQIASAADRHFKVFKKRVKNRFITGIERLQSEERVREIASLLSGKSITQKAIEGAREILKKPGGQY
jgi:DNA repair protein RecN (Recombination protein N)